MGLYGEGIIMRKKIFFSLVFIFLAGIFGAIYYFIFKPQPIYDGQVRIPGISASVQAYFDEYGVPHIVAKNKHDLYFAQGYITARERMFQMDVARLAGRGELSSLFGEKTIDKDKYLKTIGIYRIAKKGYRAMGQRAKNILLAYTNGVNTYIKNNPALPLEYTILRSQPELWKPEDSVAVALLMSYSLTRSKKVDLVLDKIGLEKGRKLLELLSPVYPKSAPSVSGQSVRSSSRENTLFHLYGLLQNRKLNKNGNNKKSHGFLDVFQTPIQFFASNWMIFSGKLSASGKPIFAGSPDMKPTLPALFYINHLVCEKEKINVIGGSLPGAPGIGPLGYNGHIAWSAVNGRGDEVDYFIEKINPKNPNEYLTEKGYRKFKIIHEVLKIKKDGKIIEKPLRVLVSRHGPIVSSVTKGIKGTYAMQWSAQKVKVTDIEGLIEMNSARDFQSFRKSLKKVKTINLGLGYADKNGNIGWQFLASPPIRKKGDGTVPVPGWNGEYEWQGFISFEKLPYDFNPARGWAASFNNDPGTTNKHLTNFYLAKRAIRFEQIMQKEKKSQIDQEKILEMQLDTVSVTAQKWVPRIIEVIKTEKQFERYFNLFKNWDFRINRESVAATVFNYFYAVFMKNTFADNVGQDIYDELSQGYLHYIPDLFLLRFGNDNDHWVYDDKMTKQKKETRDDIILRSMLETDVYLKNRFGENISSWKWGKAHLMPFHHQLGSVLSFLNLSEYATNGSHDTINSGFWDYHNPFTMNMGGVIRMVVDFGHPEQATIISPPGQSGHYGSSHYGDLAQIWADGGQIPMRFMDYKKLGRILTLNPKKK